MTIKTYEEELANLKTRLAQLEQDEPAAVDTTAFWSLIRGVTELYDELARWVMQDCIDEATSGEAWNYTDRNEKVQFAIRVKDLSREVAQAQERIEAKIAARVRSYTEGKTVIELFDEQNKEGMSDSPNFEKIRAIEEKLLEWSKKSKSGEPQDIDLGWDKAQVELRAGS